jgi:hypothetical protein
VADRGKKRAPPSQWALKVPTRRGRKGRLRLGKRFSAVSSVGKVTVLEKTYCPPSIQVLLSWLLRGINDRRPR